MRTNFETRRQCGCSRLNGLLLLLLQRCNSSAGASCMRGISIELQLLDEEPSARARDIWTPGPRASPRGGLVSKNAASLSNGLARVSSSRNRRRCRHEVTPLYISTLVRGTPVRLLDRKRPPPPRPFEDARQERAACAPQQVISAPKSLAVNWMGRES